MPELDKKKIKILLVIPTYNNRGRLDEVCKKALATGYEVLVVDDGSTDGGVDTIRGLELELLSLGTNQGKGAAILEAAFWARERDYSHIITIDADGQHDPSDVHKFRDKIDEYPRALILGRRDLSGVEIPKSSRFGKKFSNFWVFISTGEFVSDSQSGYRAYPIEILTQLKTRFKRYNFEVEILVKALWAGAQVRSVDISVHYSEETRAGSHFKPFVDNYRISVTYTSLVIRNFVPIPHKNQFSEKQPLKAKNIFLHPLKFLKMLAVEKTSVNQIMLAVMLGIFLGTLPFIGCHSIVIIFFATRLKLNRLIALNISHLCAPPLVPALAVETGYLVLHGRFLTEFTLETLGHHAWDRILEYLIGSFVLSLPLAVATGLIVRLLVVIYKKLRPAGEVVMDEK